MITVTMSIIDHKYDYELELRALPAVGDLFNLENDEEDSYFRCTVETIEHYYSDDEGHTIWITLRNNDGADK